MYAKRRGKTPPILCLRRREQHEQQIFHEMDPVAEYSTKGTQTPTDETCFEFPDSFSPSPSSSSSMGFQTGNESTRPFEVPDTRDVRPALKLFRRHSTGSDVYNFSSSPTLLASFGDRAIRNRETLPGRRIFAENVLRESDIDDNPTPKTPDSPEVVGQQLRQIADDLDNGIHQGNRSRSLSVSHFFRTYSYRRRTSSSSS